MFCLRRKTAPLFAIVLALCGLVPTVDALYCRVGTKNSIMDTHKREKCPLDSYMCFQFVKCFKSNGKDVKQYTWSCLDKSVCKVNQNKAAVNTKGKSQIIDLF